MRCGQKPPLWAKIVGLVPSRCDGRQGVLIELLMEVSRQESKKPPRKAVRVATVQSLGLWRPLPEEDPCSMANAGG